MKFAKILLVFSIVFCLASIVWPLLPEVDYRIFRAKRFISSRFQAKALHVDSLKPLSESNRLIISVINVESDIVEGINDQALNKGVWHRPGTGTPDKPGNTVLTGHRFLYTGFSNNTFYNLDKLQSGDEITVFWDTKEYRYKVFEKKIVEPTAIEIEGDFGDSRLTLYTCHPLWTADKRLVVIARPSVE